MKNWLLAAACAAAFAHTGAQAASVVITQWNFNSPTADGNPATGTGSPSIGAGTASLVGAVVASFATGDSPVPGSSDPAAGDDSAWQLSNFPAQGAGDKTRGAQFLVSTAGYKDIGIRYDHGHAATSSRYAQVQYTLDGSTWTDSTVFDGNVGNAWFNGRSVDFSSIPGADNNASFGLRILSTFAPGTSAYAPSDAASTYAPVGVWRFDMVTVEGTVVPVPAALPLMLSGLTLLGGFLRRRQAKD